MEPNHGEQYVGDARQPGALADAPNSAKGAVGLRTPSESPSDEDYDEQQQDQKPINITLRRRVKQNSSSSSGIHTPEIVAQEAATPELKDSSSAYEASNRRKSRDGAKGMKTYVVASDDTELRDILRRGLERVR